MTYFADLTPYTYAKSGMNEVALNVGWIDNEHPFETGKLDTELLSTLFTLCLNPVRRTRGWHQCQFCKAPQGGHVVEWHGKQAVLGSAEIRVQGHGAIFASPDLIFHYVLEHQYLPPRPFVDALSHLAHQAGGTAK